MPVIDLIIARKQAYRLDKPALDVTGLDRRTAAITIVVVILGKQGSSCRDRARQEGDK